MLPRAQRIWSGLQAFCREQALPLSLLPATEPAAIARAEGQLQCTFPHALRALLTVHGGQIARTHWGGLLGGVNIYDTQCTSYLLPGGPHSLVQFAENARRAFPDLPAGMVPICVSMTSLTAFFLYCGTGPARGMVWKMVNGALVPACLACPKLPARDRHEGEGEYEDALLVWLEEYVARLHSGHYAVESSSGTPEEEEKKEEPAPGSASSGGGVGGGGGSAGTPASTAPAAPRFISAFNERQQRGSSHAVTHGLHLQVLSLPLHLDGGPPAHLCTSFEHFHGRCMQLLSQEGIPAAAAAAAEGAAGAPSRHYFGYSVRMWREPGAPSMVPGETGSVKLTRRRWVCQEPGAAATAIEGPGVIGLFPVLKRGGKKFAYCSQTAFASLPGEMSGCLHFAPQGWEHAGLEVGCEVGKWVMQEEREPFIYF